MKKKKDTISVNVKSLSVHPKLKLLIGIFVVTSLTKISVGPKLKPKDERPSSILH